MGTDLTFQTTDRFVQEVSTTLASMDAAEREFRMIVAREAAQNGENAVIGRTAAHSMAANPRLNDALVVRPERLLFEGDRLQSQLNAERDPVTKVLDVRRMRAQVRNALESLQARRMRARLVTDQQLKRSRTLLLSRGSSFVRPPRIASLRSSTLPIRPPGANMLRSQSLTRITATGAMSLPVRPPNPPSDLQQLLISIERVCCFLKNFLILSINKLYQTFIF